MAQFVVDGPVRQLFDAVVRPARFVEADVADGGGSRTGRLLAAGRLLAVFAVNLFLYAVPITLAGFGSTLPVGGPPPVVAALAAAGGLAPADLWTFLQRFVQNTLFLSLGAALTFVAFHGSVRLTRSSAGVLPSLHTVVYSTSAYLAGAFSVVWYVATAPAIVVVDAFVLGVQKRFVYAIVDATGTGLELPSGRPDAVDLAGATPTGRVALAVLVVTAGYFLYSLYLGSRTNHGASRLTAATTVLTVGLAPVAFVLGSIALALAGVGPA
jgi:hypothetical protein